MGSTPSGRPRDPDVVPRVREQTLRLLSERGYTQLRIDDVVAASGVAKTTIYRRWPSLDALVLDAVDHALGVRLVPETDDPLADLAGLITTVHRSLVGNPIGWTLPAIGISLAQHPELGPAYRQRFIDPVRDQALRLLRRAQATGAVNPVIEAAILVDAMAGVFVFRRLFDEPPPLLEDLIAFAEAAGRAKAADPAAGASIEVSRQPPEPGHQAASQE